jgi:cell division protein ZapA
MADVRLNVAGREYVVTCRDGEEARLQSLGALVDEMAREAGGAAGGLNESRQLLFASLLLADKLHDNRNTETMIKPVVTQNSNAMDDPALEQAAVVIEKLADRLEQFADKLEK